MHKAHPRRSFAILEAGPINPALEERFGSHGAFFRAYLAPHAPDVEFPVYRVYLGQFPESPTAHDAFIVTGSSHSVYEKLDWIQRLKTFVRAAAQSQPVVGICFGHQLIAEAFGGRVEKAHQGWGIGVHHYDVNLRAWWMDPELTKVSLIASHQDQVVDAPPGAQILAGSAFCPVGIMQLGPNVMSIQAHPESPHDYSRALYEGRRERIGEALVDTAVSSLALPIDADDVARWILTFFAHDRGRQSQPTTSSSR